MKNPLLLLTSILFLLCENAHAQGGLLDLSFGTQGIIANETYPSTVAKTGVLATSDRIYSILQGVNDSPLVVYVRSFNMDGTIDNTFGASGTLTIEDFSGTEAVLNTDQTKIYITGRNSLAQSGVMEVDLSTGIYNMNFFPTEADYSDLMFYIAISDNNEVFLGGYHLNNLISSGAIRVVKFDQNLNVDASFGVNGVVTFSEVEGMNGSTYNLADLEVDHQGNVFLLGKLDEAHKMIKLLPSGEVDMSFTQATALAPFANFNDLIVSNNNQLLVSPDVISTQYIIRMNNDGSIDNSFVNAGVFQIDSPISDYLIFFRKLLVDSDDNIIAVGSYQSYTTNNYEGKCLLKLDPSGAVIPEFGLTFNNFNYGCGYNFSLNDNVASFQPDGKILSIDFGVCFDTESTLHYDNVISRYNTESTIASANENEEIDFHIFPNPASDFINIQLKNISKNRPLEILISDFSGKVVWKSRPVHSSPGLMQIDTSLFPAGVYSVIGLGQNENKATRFVVVK
jgi:hypothetical protein